MKSKGVIEQKFVLYTFLIRYRMKGEEEGVSELDEVEVIEKANQEQITEATVAETNLYT